MPIGVQNFEIPSFEQANPFLTGMNAGQQLISNMLAQRLANMQAQTAQAKLPYVGPTEQANLIAKQLQNQITQPYAEQATPFAEAALALAQAQPGLTRAQAGLAGAQANKFNVMTPLEAQQMSLSNELSRQLNPMQVEQTKRALANPLMQMGDIGKEFSAIQYVQSHPDQFKGINTQQANTANDFQQGSPEQAPTGMPAQSQNPMQSLGLDLGNPLMNAMVGKKFFGLPYQQKMTQAFNWVHTPPEAKNYMIALAAGMGINVDQAIKEFSDGKTIDQIAIEKGFDPTNMPAPDFLPTRGNIQQLKQRQAALAEIEGISKFVKEGIAPFSRTIMGYSPAQVGEAIRGSDPDAQAKFLAARSLAPELANLRLMLAGARPGITAQQEMSRKAMSNANIFQGLVSPEVFKKSQELVDKTLREAFSRAEESMSRVGKKFTKETGEKSPKEEGTKVSKKWRYNPATQSLEMKG